MSDAVDVALVIGSRSDWDTLRHAAQTLDTLGVRYEARVLSAHRAPDALFEYAEDLDARGVKVVIAAAGGAAALPGMLAAKLSVPVLGVPVPTSALSGLDSLLSIVQMPAGVPVGALAIGRAGAINAALLAVSILAQHDAALREALQRYRAQQTAAVLQNPDPRTPPA